MDWKEKLTQIWYDLERIRRMPTVTNFVWRYLRIIYEHAEQCGASSERLLTLFQALISYEIWHHQVIEKLSASPEMQVRYLVPLGVEMRTALLRLIRQLEHTVAITPDEIVIRELLKAHCYYQLGETEEVIKSLGEAVSNGAAHPIIFFAIGYNRHRLALTKYARWEPIGQRLIITDKDSFEREMRRVLEDLHDGLSHSGREPFDAQLYFWIGRVHEILGESENAVAAYERARAIDPETFDEEVTNLLLHMRREPSRSEGYIPQEQPHKSVRRPSPELDEERVIFSRITEEEMERLRQALNEIKTISDLFRRKDKGSETSGDN